MAIGEVEYLPCPVVVGLRRGAGLVVRSRHETGGHSLSYWRQRYGCDFVTDEPSAAPLLLLLERFLHLADDLTERRFQSLREPHHINQADVAFATFDVADIGAMNARQVAQSFLADASALPDLPHRHAERFFDLRFHIAGKLSVARTLSLQAMSGVSREGIQYAPDPTNCPSDWTDGATRIFAERC